MFCFVKSCQLINKYLCLLYKNKKIYLIQKRKEMLLFMFIKDLKKKSKFGIKRKIKNTLYAY